MNKSRIANMTKFGESNDDLQEKWHDIEDISQLPEEMQIVYDNVNEDASYADFICFADRRSIDIKYICGLSGFAENDVFEIIADAKRLGIYNELADNFLV